MDNFLWLNGQKKLNVANFLYILKNKFLYFNGVECVKLPVILI